MKTITIPNREYLQMQQTVEYLQQQLKLLQDQLKWYLVAPPMEPQPIAPLANFKQPVSIKRGSAKAIITYLAADFTAPLPDFQDYMSL
jgi:hypothetical protein